MDKNDRNNDFFFFCLDNIFILTQTLQRDQRLEGEDIETQIGRVVGQVGPAMLLTSLSESIAFFLGALTPMPAVRLFSLYAALSVLIDFILQITIFVTFIALDHKRMLRKRFDVLYCLQLESHPDENNRNRRLHFPKWSCKNEPIADDVGVQTPLQVNPNEPVSAKLFDEAIKVEQNEKSSTKNGGLLLRIFRNYYAPLIMHKYVRPTVIFIFFTWLAVSIALLPYVKIGLDQNLTMPKDSYMIDYFSALKQYFAVGPPVYFIIKEGSKSDIIIQF